MPIMKALLGAHDEIGLIYDCHHNHFEKSVEKFDLLSYPKNYYLFSSEILSGKMPVEAMRIVGLRRVENKPLGFTVEVNPQKLLVVARILSGGIIEKQGLLHPGDVILEINGNRVNTPEALQIEVSRAKENLTLKVAPHADEIVGECSISNYDTTERPGKKLMCFMRALFDYNPLEDSLLPCKDIGLPFKSGDILQIVSVKDPNWWQAKNTHEQSERIGLIPSQELEERRKAFVVPEADFAHKIGLCGTRVSKRKKTTMYKSIANCEFDKADLMLYEEVTKMPPFRRKTLVLIGVPGVGRRTLKTRLVNSDSERFGFVLPHTTRPKRSLEETGNGYYFTNRELMEEQIKRNEFLEYGEHNGHLYGLHLDSVKEVIRSGRMCILDCAPSTLKFLHNSQELMPFVIFIAAPGMEQLRHIYSERRATGSTKNLMFDRQSSIRFSSRRARTLESLASLYEEDDLIATVEESSFVQRRYAKYFDMVIVNENFDSTFQQVVKVLDQMSHEEQWVPVDWIY
ncbi:MAGUK p55 subfamily member 6 isoform X2 [Rhagoletis pomonella]|uniref:MAGUK p55 subfamily member 6 isoform X2 n=1 Tax=Rhagoletis pomonella TaxID=28610 RepID=UPI001785B279|nr:MAGUK p55 subfamily member 6 isoform X2 [Rhagoletis pomonella]